MQNWSKKERYSFYREGIFLLILILLTKYAFKLQDDRINESYMKKHGLSEILPARHFNSEGVEIFKSEE